MNLLFDKNIMKEEKKLILISDKKKKKRIIKKKIEDNKLSNSINDNNELNSHN